MIFNSFPVANDNNFGAQWPSSRGRRFFLPTNKTLWTSQPNKVTQDLSLICICKQKTFSPVLSLNLSQKDKLLPVKTSTPNFVTFFVYFGNSLLD